MLVHITPLPRTVRSIVLDEKQSVFVMRAVRVLDKGLRQNTESDHRLSEPVSMLLSILAVVQFSLRLSLNARYTYAI